MAIELTKTIYETTEVNTFVLSAHHERVGNPPKGYHWQARKSQAGVIVEAVEDEPVKVA